MYDMLGWGVGCQMPEWKGWRAFPEERPPKPLTSEFPQEDRDEDETFRQCGENNPDLHDLSLGTRVAAYCLGRFRADQAHADTGAGSRKAHMDVSSHLSK